jgi:selenium metabolism protein YedF
MKTVDARGMACPRPIILAKKAINGLSPGGQMALLVDNETARQNVERFCKDNGVAVSLSQDGPVFILTMTKLHKEAIAADGKAYCGPDVSRKPYVIVFASETMGSGPPELGAILLKAFVNTIKDVTPLPSHLVFYNTGVHLVVEGSALIDPLTELQNMGIAILACGTCLDYFNVKSKLRVGTVSNMYSILETLSKAGNVVKP